MTSILLASCATDYSKLAPAEVSEKITVKDSEFDSHRKYLGPDNETHTMRGVFTDYEHSRIIANVNKKSGEISYQIYVSVLYSGGWRLYQSASFPGGQHASLNTLKENVNFCNGGLCSYTEEFYIETTEEYLSRYLDKDLRFRLNSKSGHANIISIPNNYIEGVFLAVIQPMKNNN